MNTDLLRLARKCRGVRSWLVPGFDNAAQLFPSSRSPEGWGAVFRWPCRRHNGEQVVRSVDLDRHLVLARNAARELLR